VYQQKHRYLALGIEIGNEAEERSRIKMIASLGNNAVARFIGMVVGLLRLRFEHPIHGIKI
jgi:hypothetical protein